jgi:hypothetical protein
MRALIATMVCVGGVVSAFAAEPEEVCRDAAAVLTQSNPWSVSVSGDETSGFEWTVGGASGTCHVEGGQVMSVAFDGASVGTGAAADSTFECESRDGRRHECGFSGHGFVRMVEQLSTAACVEGQSWGVSGSVVWVDDGCRGRFELVSNPGSGGWSGGSWSGGTWSGTYTVTCESRDNKRVTCDLPAEGTVRVREQLSNTRCEPGESWGTYGDSVWVDRGCRAVFEVVPAVVGSSTYRITCESEGGRREECALRGRGRAQVHRQLSNTRCEPGTTYGVDGTTLWVKGGCRAEFEIVPTK